MTLQTRPTVQRSRGTSPSMEQYLETIARLLRNDRVTSVSQIAAAIGVSRPAASRSVRYLAQKELVAHKAYGYVALTPKGEALAARLHARHQALYRFLRTVLLFEQAPADAEACRLEHLVDDALVDRLARLTAFFESNPDVDAQWRSQVGELPLQFAGQPLGPSPAEALSPAGGTASGPRS